MKKLMKKMMVMIMAIAMALTTAAMPAFAAAPQGYTITADGVCSSRRASDKIVGSWAGDYGMTGTVLMKRAAARHFR